MNEDKNEEKVISKIKIEDNVYEIKDTECRDILDVLLGKKEPNSIDKKIFID